MMRSLAAATIAVFALANAQPAAAEATTLRAAKQFGLGYVQFMIMEDLKLAEKHAQAAGLGDIKVEWNTFRSSDVMNDALLSGSVDFVSLGVPGLMTIWDRTKGIIDGIAYAVLFLPSMAILFYLSLDEFVYAWSIGERSTMTAWQPPLWPFRAVVPLTAALLFLQGISELMKSLWAARTGKLLVHHEKIEI